MPADDIPTAMSQQQARQHIAGLLGAPIGGALLAAPVTVTWIDADVALADMTVMLTPPAGSLNVPPTGSAASRTLGAGAGRTFFRVVLPLARTGLIAGLALSFARGLGEFGATIMFAGSLRGVTQTLPLAIYEQFAVNFDTAIAMGALLVVISLALLLTLKLSLSWQPSRRTSVSAFARSS